MPVRTEKPPFLAQQGQAAVADGAKKHASSVSGGGGVRWFSTLGVHQAGGIPSGESENRSALAAIGAAFGGRRDCYRLTVFLRYARKEVRKEPG
jgi:hypothetical protein